jgi:hypothetical protein
MKRLTLFTTALALSLFAGQAYAETIRGTVASVASDGESIQVSRVAENGSGTEEVKVSLKDDTQYNGVGAAAELQLGQNVNIEADQNFFTRAWSAASVDTNAAATEAPVNSMVSTDSATAIAANDGVTGTNDGVTVTNDGVTATDPNALAGSTAPESFSDSTASRSVAATTEESAMSSNDNSPSGLTDSTSGGSNDTTTASNGADTTASSTDTLSRQV